VSQELAPHRFPRNRHEWQEFAAWGYAAGGGLGATSAWLFMGWVIVTAGRPFSYESGNTPIVLDTSDAGILGILLAIVVFFGSLVVWVGGAGMIGLWSYGALESRLADQIGDRNTLIGAFLGSVAGLVVALVVLAVLLSYAIAVAAVYAFGVAAVYVVFSVVFGRGE
jgi:hypothetical protein